MTFKPCSTYALTGALGCLITGGFVSTTFADFDGASIGGEWYAPDLGTLVDEFEAVVDPNIPEYFYKIPGHPFDGYFINFAGSSVLFGFSTTDFETYAWNEEEFNGWIFTDVDGSLDGFQSVSLGATSGTANYANIEIGVLNEDQFFVNFGTLGEDQLLHNGDYVSFDVTFVPAPMGAIALLGLGCARRRRR
jgi:hypothetical protein